MSKWQLHSHIGIILSLLEIYKSFVLQYLNHNPARFPGSTVYIWFRAHVTGICHQSAHSIISIPKRIYLVDMRCAICRPKVSVFFAAITILASLVGCSNPQPWPESPLYVFPKTDPEWNQPEDLDAAIRAVAGHYAHFDVVANEDVTTRTPMRTFVVSYGFTDFLIEDGKLLQVDRFCHAEQKLNQKNVTFPSSIRKSVNPYETTNVLIGVLVVTSS